MTGKKNLRSISETGAMRQSDNRREIRNFGLIVGGIFSLIGVWPYFKGEDPRLWAVVIGGALIALGSVLPQSLAPVHRAWMFVGHIMGWINTRILLAIVFYGVITPIGMARRWFSADTINHSFDTSLATYRVTRKGRPGSHMKRQF
jgi:hypothetical protein